MTASRMEPAVETESQSRNDEAPPSNRRPGSALEERLTPLLNRTVWLWPALLTLVLGIRGSWRPQPWRDEFATWSAATRSTGDLLELLQHVDAVSGAYYLLMNGWVSVFGDSPTMLRLPSALALTGAAVFVALTGRRLFGTASGLIAGLLFAVLPTVSRYSQEARSYAFVVLAVAAATFFLFRALERPSWQRWLPYAVSVAAAGLFHMVSLVFLSSHAVVVAMHWWRDRRKGLLFGFPAAVLIGLVPVIPLVLLGTEQSKRQIGWLQAPELNTFVDYWHNMFGSALVSAGVLALAAIPAGWARGRRPAFEIGLMAALPILLTWFISQGQTAYFFDRYQLYTLPAWAVLAGAGLGKLKPRFLGVVGLVVVALLGWPDQEKLRTATAHENTNGKAAAKVITDGYQPGDGFAPVRGDKSWAMTDLEIEYYLPDRVELKDVFAAKSALQKDDLFADACPQPASCLNGVNRVWVVTLGEGDDPYANLPKNEAEALRAAYKVTQVKHVRGLTVSLSERK
ncbi:glycosyltransferase family 39 protein [Kitasatospora sp. NPDC004289]